MCAQWVPDVRVARGGECCAVEGVLALPAERWGVPCALCGLAAGVALRCNAGHCGVAFHALCGRNAGQYLAARGEPGRAQSFRAYCGQHSAPQRRKDAAAAAEVGGIARTRLWPVCCMHPRLQRCWGSSTPGVAYTVFGLSAACTLIAVCLCALWAGGLQRSFFQAPSLRSASSVGWQLQLQYFFLVYSIYKNAIFRFFFIFKWMS